MTATERVYPLTAPADDARFAFGLVIDVARVIERHGYPPVSGPDLVELRQAVFAFLYAPARPVAVADDTVTA